MADKVPVGGGPAFTLWAAIVAERMGYSRDAALTLGWSVSGPDCLGVDAYEEPVCLNCVSIELLGRRVCIQVTDRGVRATAADEPVDPGIVCHYLENSLGPLFPVVQQAMEEFARRYKPNEIGELADVLFETFCPPLPGESTHRAALRELDLEFLRKNAER